MVVLTLHRDHPLSTEEIRSLPAGCYPVLGQGDVIARAELALPIAHVARFSAALARAVPDADFAAEDRPTARATALLEAGELDDPYWAYTPPLSFRVDPPGAADLAERPGEPDPERAISPAPAPEVQQILPETPDSIDFAELVARSRAAQETEPEAPLSEPAPPPEPEPEPEGLPVSIAELVSRFRSDTPSPAPVPPARGTGGGGVPQHILNMLQSIREQELHTGQSVSPVVGEGEAIPVEAPVPVPQPGPAALPPALPEEEPARSEFWGLVERGDLEGAEARARDGLPGDELPRLGALFMDDDPSLVVFGLKVSRIAKWGAGARLARRLLHHPDADVRKALPRTLVVLGGDDVEADLAVLSRDTDLSVSDAARAALRRMQRRSRF